MCSLRHRAGARLELQAILRHYVARMLHVTNGDIAVERLRASGVGGDVLAWRDVLHEGPVPAGLDAAGMRDVRARFLARRFLVDVPEVLPDMEARDRRLDAAIEGGEEIVLWFETDLYDMLQLAQVLDRLRGGRARLVLVGQDRFVGVGELEPAELAPLLDRATPVSAELVEAGRAMWAAVRSPEPTGLAALAAGTPALPALGDAARRLLEQLPWAGSGLSRSERALLDAVHAGAETRSAAFRAAAAGEERPFMSDAIAFDELAAMAQPPAPLLTAAEPLRTTDLGAAVVAGEAEWTGRAERWLGGVRLSAGAPEWRWDAAASRVVAAR